MGLSDFFGVRDARDVLHELIAEPLVFALCISNVDANSSAVPDFDIALEKAARDAIDGLRVRENIAGDIVPGVPE